MADRKIFAETRLRRLRQRLGLSQSRMATEIGVSPAVPEPDRAQSASADRSGAPRSSPESMAWTSPSFRGRTVQARPKRFREIFADPLLAGEVASPAELSEFVEAAPNAARGMARLFPRPIANLSNGCRTCRIAWRSEGEAPTAAAARLPGTRWRRISKKPGPISTRSRRQPRRSPPSFPRATTRWSRSGAALRIFSGSKSASCRRR